MLKNGGSHRPTFDPCADFSRASVGFVVTICHYVPHWGAPTRKIPEQEPVGAGVRVPEAPDSLSEGVPLALLTTAYPPVPPPCGVAGMLEFSYDLFIVSAALLTVRLHP